MNIPHTVSPRFDGHDYSVNKLLYGPLTVVPEFPAIAPRVVMGSWYAYWSGLDDLFPLTAWQARHHRSEIITLTGIDIRCPPPAHKERLQALARQQRVSRSARNEVRPGFIPQGAMP